MKNALIIFAVLLCVAISGSKLMEAYKSHMPVAFKNECVNLNDGFFEVDVQVFGNNIVEGKALVLSLGNGSLYTFGFSEMRKFNAKRVECPKWVK